MDFIINPAIIIVILNPSHGYSERSEESCRFTQDRLREGSRISLKRRDSSHCSE